MRQTYPKLCLIIGLVFGIFSCDSNKLDVDVSGIDLEVKFTRFEDLFFNLDSATMATQFPVLEQEHPEITEFLVTHMFNAKRQNGVVYKAMLDDINDTMVQRVYRDVKNKFADLSGLEAQVSDAFRRVMYHLPDDSLPKFYTFITLSDVQAFTYPGIITLSLDRFMGQDYNYPTPNTPNYMRVRMRPEFAAVHLLKAYFDSRFPEDLNTDATLLSRMIHEGKKLYFLDAVLPKEHDSMKIEYAGQKLEWCHKNEYQIYDHMVKQNLFYETNHLKTDRYLHEAPFTQAGGVPPECPARLGQWFGWQIVRNYMDNTGSTLAQLMAEKDYKAILKKAKYKP